MNKRIDERAAEGDHRFQVNLEGMISLLSEHLYSDPKVFVRELLQNAVDAIVAREKHDPTSAGQVEVELYAERGHVPTLTVSDNGIGLTAAEVHEFLATLGQSSKRDVAFADDFIGRFGIGLLSAFVVSDEIVVVTRSANPPSEVLEWRGRADGTYSLQKSSADVAVGTQVFLRAKEEHRDLYTADFVRGALGYYGKHLATPIRFTHNRKSAVINVTPPWRFRGANLREKYLAYGREQFETDFLDAIELHSETGKVRGVAFILPQAQPLNAKRKHRVYLKNMLVTDDASDLLPDWAFFVQCVVNSQALRPTADREGLYQDDVLIDTQAELGDCLRQYLMELARKDEALLSQLVSIHFLTIKALAIEDRECFRLFADFLPFETTLGEMTLGAYRRQFPVVRFVSSADQFRQISAVAAAQGECILNASYVYDLEFIEQLRSTYPSLAVEQVDPNELVQEFGELSLGEQRAAYEFMQLVNVVLQKFGCAGEMRKFKPTSQSTLYTANPAANFLRSLDDAKELASDLWAGVLENLATEPNRHSLAQLCLNYDNPLVQRLMQVRDQELLKNCIELMYVQALLLGHYTLRRQETMLLNDGLLQLIDRCVTNQKSKKK